MENPLEPQATSGEASAAKLQRLIERVEALERQRTIPASMRAASLAALKLQLPASAPNNTIVIGRLEGGAERVYLYIYDSLSGKWFRSGAFSEA